MRNFHRRDCTPTNTGGPTRRIISSFPLPTFRHSRSPFPSFPRTREPRGKHTASIRHSRARGNPGASVIPAPTFRHSRARGNPGASVIPAPHFPSFSRTREPRRVRHSRSPLPSFPLPTFRHSRSPFPSFPRTREPRRVRHSRSPFPSFPIPLSVIPAHAGTQARPSFPLPSFRHSRARGNPGASVVPAPPFRHSRARGNPGGAVPSSQAQRTTPLTAIQSPTHRPSAMSLPLHLGRNGGDDSSAIPLLKSKHACATLHSTTMISPRPLAGGRNESDQLTTQPLRHSVLSGSHTASIASQPVSPARTPSYGPETE